MIKNKYKKIVSAMLLMTMIATTFSVDVFAGGGASCISVECEGLFKGCCTGERSDSSKTECIATPTTPSSITVNGSENSVINGSNTIIINQMQPQDEKEGHLVIGKEIEKKVVTDPITPPAHQPEPVSTHNDNTNYKFKKDTGQLILLSNYKGTEPIATYMDKSQLESIKTVNIERGVVRLVGTFHECYHLTSVIISDTVKEIGENAFADCKDLESIKIPASVTKIDAYAFKGCTSLTEVIIPDSVTEISEHAFDGCPFKPHKSDPPPEPHKSDVVIDPISPPTSFIPTEVTKVDNSIQTSEPEVVIDPISPPTNIISTETDRMDNSVQASEEVAKTDNSIQACEEIVKVDNSTQACEEVAKTDNSAQACEEVAKTDNSTQACEEIVKVDNSTQACEEVAKINSSIQTSEIEVVIDSITPPTNIISTETDRMDNSIQTCEDYKMPDDKGVCGNNVNYLFYQFSGELVIQGKGEMKDYSYQETLPWSKYKDKIKSVKIENGVTKIGSCVFYECTNLTSVIISSSVKYIHDLSFSGSTGLTSINVDKENQYYKSIDDVLFSKDETTIHTYPIGKKVINYIIPYRITEIGNGVFARCSGLTTSITIPDSVKKIGSYAFYDCIGLTSITIPNSVREIGERAFYDCTNLTSIIIPDSLKIINNYAFGKCKKLTSITYLGNTEPNCKSAFYGCTELKGIRVPSDYKGKFFCGIKVIKEKI